MATAVIASPLSSFASSRRVRAVSPYDTMPLLICLSPSAGLCPVSLTCGLERQPALAAPAAAAAAGGSGGGEAAAFAPAAAATALLATAGHSAGAPAVLALQGGQMACTQVWRDGSSATRLRRAASGAAAVTAPAGLPPPSCSHHYLCQPCGVWGEAEILESSQRDDQQAAQQQSREEEPARQQAAAATSRLEAH